MPYRLDTHVPIVDANVIHKVDAGNGSDLYSMWTVFSRCADSIKQGRRLENLSWRLWQRETSVVENEEKTTPDALPQIIPTETRIPDLPRLSGSVGSLVDQGAVDLDSVLSPLEIARPCVRRQDSCTSTHSKRGRHISSGDFEKMIVSIVNDQILLPAPPQLALVSKGSQPAPPPFERSASPTTGPQLSAKSAAEACGASPRPSPQSKLRTAAVRGFELSQLPVPQTIARATQFSPDAIPELTSSPVARPMQSKKPPRVAPGGSRSASEQDQSLDDGNEPAKFEIGVSSEEDGSPKSVMASSQPSALVSRFGKHASSSKNVTNQTTLDHDAIGSNTDYIDESAIDDDDPSNWADSDGDSDEPNMDDKLFRRVDSKPNLTSCRSLVALMLAQNERARTHSNRASQSTSTADSPSLGASPNDSDEAPLTMKGMRGPGLEPIHEAPWSTAQPIMISTDHMQAQAALSPRTTRRNMLATELTESLRRHLLWERQQKSSTANAVLKRRHMLHDEANLKQCPKKPCMKSKDDNTSS
ncbi:uncharacterized protein NECHADRAFT_55279 [Fusarium vanettenii 77-13-4]|uniref:Uncharacterized protein n=1 Tax=Fusarium vanettenii (strain ATCC MYA-4622 / CBS 123669 / FGSC 9596 / NRRL 45880 / 77-13-4) TaxID=660122 RepID=C7ZBZ1_FUSV7|nr:uncharacterized protein NECHADRAFT_55279 [Fusarium vanettenii 77-13-4]EEU38498.1 hypothetical protein NECHADRAFT_55279 [Fusarium vanettenii 77-13-4]